MPKTAQPSATVPLPQRAPPSPEVEIAPQPQVSPAPLREIRPAPAPEVRSRRSRARSGRRGRGGRSAARRRRTIANASKAKPLLQQPRYGGFARSAGTAKAVATASGQRSRGPAGGDRRVRVGAPGEARVAAHGPRPIRRWLACRPSCRPDRNSKGRVFYRFRIGTTSQAHSECSASGCSRSASAARSWGLPWKAKVER